MIYLIGQWSGVQVSSEEKAQALEKQGYVRVTEQQWNDAITNPEPINSQWLKLITATPKD